MTVQSVRANELTAYISKREPEKNLFVRIELEGRVDVLSVYSVPIDRLTFNIRNGRFASELRAKEKALNRKLDPHVEIDAAIIRQLLLDQNEAETKALREDLLKHSQIDAGIITRDGAVINANRRMAVISSLFDVTHDQKWEYLKVAVLPDTVSEKDLWRIEAGLQFGKDFRLEYGPINELLKLREGIDCGLKPVDISATLMGRYSDKQVEARLRVLMLIDNYLDSIGKPGDYAWIGQQRLMEKFNSLSDNVIETLKKSGYDPLDLHRLTSTGFSLISKTDRSHWDIRKLAPIARQPEAKKALLEALPGDPLAADADVLEEAFSTAEDIVEGQKEKDKPDRLLQKALSAVNSIDRKNPKLKSRTTQALVQQLLHACETLKNE
jgi:hypothetical protein